MTKNKSTITTLTLCAIFFPYIGSGLLGTDVQPTYIYASLIYFFLYKAAFKIKEIIFILVILFVGVFSSYIWSIEANSIINFKVSVSILGAFLIYNFGRSVSLEITYRVAFKSIFAYFFFALLFYFFPDFYSLITTPFYNEKILMITTRTGWSPLSPEPGDFAFTISWIFFLLLLLRSVLFKYPRSPSLMFVGITYGLMVLVTKALLGYISLIFIIIRKMRIRSVSFILALSFIMISVFPDIRPVIILIDLFSNPFEVVEKTSIFYRAIHNHIALLYFFENFGLPAGFGSYSDIAKEIMQDKTFQSLYHSREVFFESFVAYDVIESKNIFSNLMVSLGWVGVFVFYSIFKIFKNIDLEFKLLGIFMMLLFLLQSFPIAYPLPWFVLGLITQLSKKTN
jgi:hypothetical protein